MFFSGCCCGGGGLLPLNAGNLTARGHPQPLFLQECAPWFRMLICILNYVVLMLSIGFSVGKSGYAVLKLMRLVQAVLLLADFARVVLFKTEFEQQSLPVWPCSLVFLFLAGRGWKLTTPTYPKILSPTSDVLLASRRSFTVWKMARSLAPPRLD